MGCFGLLYVAVAVGCVRLVRVASGCIGWLWVALGCVRLRWVAWGCAELRWVDVRCVGLMWALWIDFKMLRVALGCGGVRWAALGCIGLRWVVVGCVGLRRAALGHVGLLWVHVGCVGLFCRPVCLSVCLLVRVVLLRWRMAIGHVQITPRDRFPACGNCTPKCMSPPTPIIGSTFETHYIRCHVCVPARHELPCVGVR